MLTGMFHSSRAASHECMHTPVRRTYRCDARDELETLSSGLTLHPALHWQCSVLCVRDALGTWSPGRTLRRARDVVPGLHCLRTRSRNAWLPTVEVCCACGTPCSFWTPRDFWLWAGTRTWVVVIAAEILLVELPLSVVCGTSWRKHYS